MAKQYSTVRANSFRDDNQPDISDPKEEKEIKNTRKLKEPKPERKKTEKASKTKKEHKPTDGRNYRVLGLFFLLFSFYLLLAFTSYVLTWTSDYDYAHKVINDFAFNHFVQNETPENWVGKFGAILAFLFISQSLGIASFLFILILLVTGLRLFVKFTLFPLKQTLICCFFGIIWIPVFMSVGFPGYDLLYGLYGYQGKLLLFDFLGYSGLIMLLVFTSLSFLIINFNIPFRWIKKHDRKGILVENNNQESPKIDFAENVVVEEEPMVNQTSLIDEPVWILNEVSPDNPYMPKANDDLELIIETPHLEITQIPEEKICEITNGHQGIDTKFDPTLDLPHYKFPTLDLLSKYGSDEIVVNKEELEANKNRIVETLKNYSIKIQRIQATIGPAVTLYEIVPEAGVRISKIKNLEDDIALSLSALGIRIIAPIPGKGTIGIEVPNKNPEIVSMRSLIASEKFQKCTYELPLVLGKTISNETFIVDLAKMPHLLMAGATGQGKSVGLNTIITSLLYKKHPSQIKFVLVDPKKVELSLFSKIERHFLAKLPDAEEAIITDTKKVIRTLNSLNIEMDTRYDLLQAGQVRNIREYNDKFIARKLNPNNGHHFLPYLIVVVDEFADLIMTAGREIETPLTRLAQLARAVGIHLVIATQRPSVNIITGTIKANFPARLAFRVISKIDSRTILDTGGADQLIGRGDMLLSTGSDLTRLQCAFVDTPEIEHLTEFIGSQRGFPDAYHLPEFNEEETESSKEFDPESKDVFFLEAARLIVSSQQGSTSLLQRKLKLGYNRAGRIIDQLESAGIVGPFEGSKAREVRFKDLSSLELHLKYIGES